MTRTGRNPRQAADPYRVEETTWTREEILRARGRQEPMARTAGTRKGRAPRSDGSAAA